MAVSATLAACLASCGGGDGSGAPPAPTPPPVQSPAPTPAPAPAPAPAPSPTYDTVFDFAADFRYAFLTAELEKIGQASGGEFVVSEEVRSLDGTGGNAIAWDASAETVTYDFQRETFSYGPAQLDVAQADGYRWRFRQDTPLRDEIFTLVQPQPEQVHLMGARHELTYDLADGSGRSVQSASYAVGGAFTEIADLPTDGAQTFVVSLSSTSPDSDSGSGLAVKPADGSTARTDEMTVDFSSTDFTASIPLQQLSAGSDGTRVAFTMRLTGTYDPATGRISGTVDSPDADYSGSFEMGFFGARARELGLVFVISSPTVPSVVGRMTGNRPG